MNSGNSTAKKISLNGVLLALTVITLFAATTLPTSRLALYALSSFFTAIIIIEFSVKAAWAFYAASAILTLLVLPDKIGLIPYAAFFGVYGIIKFYSEKLPNAVLEFAVKLVYFNICLGLAYFLLDEFLLKNIEIKFPLWVFGILLEIAFIIYDYVFTRFIQYYNDRLKRILKI